MAPHPHTDWGLPHKFSSVWRDLCQISTTCDTLILTKNTFVTLDNQYCIILDLKTFVTIKHKYISVFSMMTTFVNKYFPYCLLWKRLLFWIEIFLVSKAGTSHSAFPSALFAMFGQSCYLLFLVCHKIKISFNSSRLQEGCEWNCEY